MAAPKRSRTTSRTWAVPESSKAGPPRKKTEGDGCQDGTPVCTCASSRSVLRKIACSGSYCLSHGRFPNRKAECSDSLFSCVMCSCVLPSFGFRINKEAEKEQRLKETAPSEVLPVGPLPPLLEVGGQTRLQDHFICHALLSLPGCKCYDDRLGRHRREDVKRLIRIRAILDAAVARRTIPRRLLQREASGPRAPTL